MQPVSVSIDVPQARDAVYAFLDVMANHEPFTDHMLRDWEYSGPPAGVGSSARVVVVLGGRREPVEIETVEAAPGRRIVERNVSAAGRRVAHGTYELSDRDDGGTHIVFTYAWTRAPLPDRLLSPLVRAVMRRGLQRSMDRLKGELALRTPTARAA
jgi:Polyketide cyclase / dehydrase and lipid transport